MVPLLSSTFQKHDSALRVQRVISALRAVNRSMLSLSKHSHAVRGLTSVSPQVFHWRWQHSKGPGSFFISVKTEPAGKREAKTSCENHDTSFTLFSAETRQMTCKLAESEAIQNTFLVPLPKQMLTQRLTAHMENNPIMTRFSASVQLGPWDLIISICLWFCCLGVYSNTSQLQLSLVKKVYRWWLIDNEHCGNPKRVGVHFWLTFLSPHSQKASFIRKHGLKRLHDHIYHMQNHI